MNIQPFFNEYKAVTFKRSYFSKSEDQCSAAMKQAAEEALGNELGHLIQLKIYYRPIQVNGNAQFKRQCTIFCQRASSQGFTFSLICKYKFTRRALKNTLN